jgi:hypothetical protein
MAAIHFEGKLPRGITLLEDAVIGSTSGNPTEATAYMFMDAEEPPHYAAGFVLARDDENEKQVVIAGPLTPEEYTRSLCVTNVLGVLGSAETLAQNEDLLLIQSNVPKHTNTEHLLGTFVATIFEYDR